ncbi:hypothetical protein [Bdellovibrio sp. NC01]|uniref:hypothetical protein n=1 Tax=Bdellovibrio sp. NC01 TaxID=2220073 RepID=UPI001159EF4D|nr:hypothetical protein [Bdellovibrio sp. NC01]QDK38127.1 hypothetical protein DOE51_11285 [Bdellovibrio sp. NC01]
MPTLKNQRYLLAIFIVIFVLVGLRYCYYGAVFSSCIYSEKELPLTAEFTDSVFILTKSVAVVRGESADYKCLPHMGQIRNMLVEAQYADHYRTSVVNGKIEYIDVKSGLNLYPMEVVAVTKHGITTMDSGSGPIYYVVMRDPTGQLYQVATVSLGLNKGDEFMKAVKNGKETLLNPMIRFTEEQK